MTELRSILIVEDDEAIASGLALNLRLEGFRTEIVADGADALRSITERRPGLVLLDITLPHRNGLDILADLRRTDDTTPVIILSARQSEPDKVAALRLGADDYVTKPFGVAELLARIAALLRRVHAAPPTAEPERLRFGSVVVDVGTRAVTREGEDVAITRLEFELLCWFVRNPARVFDRHQLLSAVWGVAHSGTARTVDNFVAQLRQKLEDDANQPRHFVTVRGSGYRFDP